MPDTTGKIRQKALDQTGITEAMLEKDWAVGAGRVRMAIVELRSVEPHGPNLDGKKRIDYVIEAIEPVPEAQEDTVREFQRAIYRTRPEVEGQEVLDGTAGDGPTLADSAAALDSQIERDDNGIVTGVWDGSTEGPLEQPTVAEVVDEVATKRKRGKAAAEPNVAAPPIPEGGYCPFPGCGQENEHEGDHDDPSDDEDEQP